MDFGKYIKELLMLHDCVIIPGLGGFIANYKSAEIHPEQKVIRPPSKQILFNRDLVHNDGLLYAYVSKHSGYGYKEVQSLGGDYIRRIEKAIGKGLKFNIGGLGYFYRDPDQQLQFTAETSSNFLMDSYGLPFVPYREFEVGVASPEKRYRAVPADRDPLARQRRIRRIVFSAAAACLGAALVLIPVKMGYFSEAGLNLRMNGRPVTETPGTIVQENQLSQTPLVYESVPEASYHIIVGSFRNFGNARELRMKLVGEGYPVRILAADNGFFRVSAGECQAREEASQLLARMRARRFPSAWMLSN